MSRQTSHPQWQRVTDHLHPGLYLALAGLALWYILSAWSFGGDGYTDYLLAIASGLILIAVAIPAALWRIWRNHSHEEGSPNESFRAWAASDFRIWQDHMKARDAAIEILLPIAAVAFGMSIFGIIIHFTAH